MAAVFNVKIRTYQFSKAVVLFINKYDFGKLNFPIIMQLLRSATSVCANIIEAKSGNSRRNLINFYSIALRSANETKYWLCLIRDTMEVDTGEIEALLQEANEISKVIAKSIISLKKVKS